MPHRSSFSAAETSPASIAGIAPSYGPKTVSAVPNAAAIVTAHLVAGSRRRLRPTRARGRWWRHLRLRLSQRQLGRPSMCSSKKCDTVMYRAPELETRQNQRATEMEWEEALLKAWGEES